MRTRSIVLLPVHIPAVQKNASSSVILDSSPIGIPLKGTGQHCFLGAVNSG